MVKLSERGDIHLNDKQRVIDEALSAVVRWSLYKFHAQLAGFSDVSVDRSTISILTRLRAAGPLRVSELADYLGLDRSTLSRQVAAAVSSGYVTKVPDESDSRASQLTLTELGEGTIDAVTTSKDRLVRQLTALMTASEVGLVAEALPIVARALAELSDNRSGAAA